MMKKSIGLVYEQNLILKAFFDPVMIPWQQYTRHLSYQNKIVYPYNWCLANLVTQGSAVLKIANAVQVSETVFSHLKSNFQQVQNKRIWVRSPWADVKS